MARRGEESGGTRRDREGCAVVHHLLAVPGEDVEDLVSVGMVVARVALAREQHHVQQAHRRVGRVRLGDQRLDQAPIECLRWHLLRIDELRGHAFLLYPWTGIALKRRTVSVIATSVGSLSIPEAPNNPPTPCVRSADYAASDGRPMGPPCQSTLTSG